VTATAVTPQEAAMSAVEFRPTDDQFAYTFGGAAAVMRIKPGTILTLWTQDCFGARVTSIDDRPTLLMADAPGSNPQTGPFHVEGAEPGDTLVVHIVDLTPARDWGVSTTMPFFGGLTATLAEPGLQPPLEERVWIYHYDSATGTLAFEARKSDFSVALAANPMLGTVGVAPALREVRSTMVPDYFGGNMDTPEMRQGTTAYFRVNVAGALFSIGDGHYKQGEGEACGSAVEGAMNATLIVDLVKGGGPAWPRLENDTHLMVVGSGRPLDAAWKAAHVDMVRWLSDLYHLETLDAYQLLSQIAESPLANVVDPNFSALAKVDRRVLPEAAVYGGIHAALRDQAAALGTITY
jgi:acetamidase/formamidase